MNLADVLPQLVALLGAVGGVAGLGAVFRIGIDRRKGRAEAARSEVDAGKVVADTAVGLVEPLRAQIEYLGEELRESREESKQSRAETEALRREVHELRGYIAQLVDALAAAGAEIPPRRGVTDLTEQRRRGGTRHRGAP